MEAIEYLIQYEADVNIQNDRGEIPLFHAIHHGNHKAVKLFLANKSDTHVNNKSALHFAAQEGQAECSLLLLKHGCQRDELDSRNRTPLDAAIMHDDPTVELLLRTPNLPETTIDASFIKFLYDSFEPKIEEARDQMEEAPDKLPKRMKTFISNLITLERSHSRFLVLLKRRVRSIEDEIYSLSAPTKENIDPEIDLLSIQLRNTFNQAIEKVRIQQKDLGFELFSPNGIESYDRWVEHTEEMQTFINELIENALDKYGLKDNVAKKLKELRADQEYLNFLNQEVAAKTVPFQEEIVAFVSVALKKLKTLELKEPIEIYERFFKSLLRQIEETNPELIRRQFRKPK